MHLQGGEGDLLRYTYRLQQGADCAGQLGDWRTRAALQMLLTD